MATVVRKGDASHSSQMTSETVQLFAALRLPQANSLVLATRENAFAIERKCDAIHLSSVSHQSTNFLPYFQVIKLNRFIGPPDSANRPRRESDAFDETLRTLKLVQLLPFVMIDKAEEAVVAAH